MLGRRKPILRRFKTIKGAMMYSFSVLIIVALVIFWWIAYNYTKDTVFNNSIAYSSQIVKQVNSDIDSYINYMENISLIIMESKDVQDFLFENKSAEELVDARQRIISQIDTIRSSRDDIVNIAILSECGHVIVNQGIEGLNPYIEKESNQWYVDTLRAEDGVNISSSHVQNLIRSSYDWVITLSRMIENQQTGFVEGIFFIDLNYESISNLCNNSVMGESGYIFIIDEHGGIIYHPQQQLLYGELREEKIQEVLYSNQDYMLVEERDKNRLYTMYQSEKTNWTVVSVAYIDELLTYKDAAQVWYTIVTILLIVATVVISNMIARILSRPIGELQNAMDTVVKGEFKEVEVKIEDENELGALSKSFNIMTERIANLIDQNKFEQEEKRKSELRALQSQINPHFLYNTLDSIIWMSAARKNDEVVEMTSALSKLFRQSISNDNEELTIREEIEYVRNYLTIQKMRYADKLSYEFHVVDEIMEESIIKFALQPLVENTIYHGLKYKKEGGLLKVKGWFEKDQNRIVIELEDNGVGMTKEALQNIFKEKKIDHKKNGVGVLNVQRRLQLAYGIDYGIHYASEEGVGTVVTMHIPRREIIHES